MKATKKKTAAKGTKKTPGAKPDAEGITTAIVARFADEGLPLTRKGLEVVSGLVQAVVREMPHARASELADEVARRFDACGSSAAPEKRRPTDIVALAQLHDAGNDLLHDYRTVELALQAGDIEAYAASFASTLRRCNDRLFELLDRLEDSRGGEIVRDGDAARVPS